MEKDLLKARIEAMLFAYGKNIDVKVLSDILEIDKKEVIEVIQQMQKEFEAQNRGIKIIKVNDGYQMCTKEEFYSDICVLFENRSKPTLSTAALEVLSIVAYNPKITRSQIEDVRRC